MGIRVSRPQSRSHTAPVEDCSSPNRRSKYSLDWASSSAAGKGAVVSVSGVTISIPSLSTALVAISVAAAVVVVVLSSGSTSITSAATDVVLVVGAKVASAGITATLTAARAAAVEAFGLQILLTISLSFAELMSLNCEIVLAWSVL